jgi:hypothetical protein
MKIGYGYFDSAAHMDEECEVLKIRLGVEYSLLLEWGDAAGLTDEKRHPEYKKKMKVNQGVTDYRYYTVLDPRSDLFTTVLLPQLLTPAYLTIQLLTLVIPIPCLYSLHLSLIYIETLELHSKSSRSCNSSHCKAYTRPHICYAWRNPITFEKAPQIEP